MKKSMWLIWKQPESRRRYKVGTLTKTNDKYTFVYEDPELSEALKVGFDYFPGFNDINLKYESDHLFANISTRLPNKKREDYLQLLNIYNLENDSNEFDILQATKGRLITDNFEFVPVFDKNKLEFDVAGTRYSKDLKKCKDLLEVNDELLFELEPDNIEDENAIKVIFIKNNNKYHIGYVPRYYTKQLAELLQNNIKYSALIKSVNTETIIRDEDITASVKLIFDV